MQYPGYWVSGAGNKVWLMPYTFDDTELSSVSDFTQSWQNGETEQDGFVSDAPDVLLKNICDRVLRRDPRFIESEPHPGFKGEVIWLSTLESLAGFISGLELRMKGSRKAVISVSDDLPGEAEIPL